VSSRRVGDLDEKQRAMERNERGDRILRCKSYILSSDEYAAVEVRWSVSSFESNNNERKGRNRSSPQALLLHTFDTSSPEQVAVLAFQRRSTRHHLSATPPERPHSS